jgi:hypothetical protein
VRVLFNGLVTDPITPVHQTSVLDEINDPSFVPKNFRSSKSTATEVSDTSVIDLTVDAVLPVVQAAEDPESIFHPSVSILCNPMYRVILCQ